MVATEFRCTAILDLYTEHDEIEAEDLHSSLTEHLDRVLSTFHYPLSSATGPPVEVSIETVTVIEVLPL